MTETLKQTHGRAFAGAADRPQAGSGLEGLFPLPLAPFEYYMVADDRSRYPMTFPMRVELEGEPDRETLDEALADALARHPLLSARLARRGPRLCWVPGAGQDQVEWPSTGSASCLPASEAIDLTHSPGVRVSAVARDGGTVLSFLFHHAVCDGIGGLTFVGDLLAFYGRRRGLTGPRPRVLAIDPAKLRERGDFDIRLPAVPSTWELLSNTLQEGWKVLSRRPEPLQNRNRPHATGASSLHVQRLDAATYRQFCLGATESGATANDLLLRDMFLTLADWNRRQGGPENGWLRITMPTSLRGRLAIRMPAANVLGYAFVTRRTNECVSPRQLLAGLASETDSIRTWSMGAMFVDGLRKANAIPGLLKASTRLSRRFSTVVLSNTGNPIRRFRARFPTDGKVAVAGDVQIHDIYGAPPVRPGTRAALAMTSCGDRLTLAMMIDPHWFSDDDATRFLSQYVAQLRRTANGRE